MRVIIFLFFFNLLIVSIVFGKDTIKIAITIDDLPSHANVPQGLNRVEIARKMLSVLKKYNVPEVYGFMCAKRILNEPDLIDVLKLWRSSGYPLGNHTYSHKSLTRSSAEEFKKDIIDNEPILKQLADDTNFKFFRYPYLHEGNTQEKRNAVRKFLVKNGYNIAHVTVDFEDWSWNDPYARCVAKNDKESIMWLRKTFLRNATDKLERAEKISKYLFKRPISHILLLHIGAFDAEMLESLLLAYKIKGAKFVSLTGAINDNIYSYDPQWVFDHGAEFIYQIMKSRGLKSSDIGLKPYLDYPQEKLDKICR
ncbi:MAG: polysaccharide deacetylase family protein [Deltaproteobacteria bacterium]|nr:polysaccharide deacetylase family protein [Deltaproteobacteria bacterium]